MKKSILVFLFIFMALGLYARKPLIGVSTSLNDGRSATKLRYSAAIEKAGGIPVLIPLTKDGKLVEETVRRLDGILFIGGDDFAPSLYGESVLNSSVQINGLCDTSDVLLMRAALRQKKSILAICRGAQLLNIVLGGSLYQDLPAQYPEALPHQGKPHQIVIDGRSRLATILSPDSSADLELTVNSFHHQAIKRLAPSLFLSASSSDGIPEAVELPGKTFILGVQFHPEIPAAQGDPFWLRLFTAFVRSARR